MSFIAEALAAVERAKTRALPSFADGDLYLIGSASAVEGLRDRREHAGTHADRLLVEVAQLFELRHEDARRGEGEEEIRASLDDLRGAVDAWADAIDTREMG
jgi:hypothetical protein